MNRTEQLAHKYLTEKLGKKNVKFQSHDSPDFIIADEKTGYEVKRLYGRCIWLYAAQFAKMRKSSLDISILVFENGHSEPTALLPLHLLENDKVVSNILVKILPDIPSVKIENDLKIELTKIAGEIQMQTGGNVSFSDAVNFLIKFYREHKEA